MTPPPTSEWIGFVSLAIAIFDVFIIPILYFFLKNLKEQDPKEFIKNKINLRKTKFLNKYEHIFKRYLFLCLWTKHLEHLDLKQKQKDKDLQIKFMSSLSEFICKKLASFEDFIKNEINRTIPRGLPRSSVLIIAGMHSISEEESLKISPVYNCI